MKSVNSYLRNEALTTIKPDWKGNPIDQRGRFVNHEFPFLPKIIDVLKWKLRGNPFAQEKRQDKYRPSVLDAAEFLDDERDGIMWLGHASFYIRAAGKGILIDPIFGTPPLVKRLAETASPLDKISQVDLVLISHDHRDHADEQTIRAITKKFPTAKLFAGLRSEALLRSWATSDNNIYTAGWFQKFDLDESGIEIYFLPTRHWSRRGVLDTNHRLWGAYLIKTPFATVYFGGDSGFGGHYRETGELFPEIDYAILGIGACEPRWFMEPVHTNASDAIKAFQDLKAKQLIPMHYGTFDLSDEAPGMPIRLLKEQASQSDITDKLRLLDINGFILWDQPA